MSRAEMVLALILAAAGAGMSAAIVIEVMAGRRWRRIVAQRWDVILICPAVIVCCDHGDVDLSDLVRQEIEVNDSLARVMGSWGKGAQVSAPYRVIVTCPGTGRRRSRHRVVATGQAVSRSA